MSLPFTHDQFLDVFASYNTALWPWAVALWIASLGVCASLILGRGRDRRYVTALLVVQWVWSALAYHALFFRSINPAAWLFAGLFLVQAALFAWYGLSRGRLNFESRHGMRTQIAWMLVAYALLYPAIGVAQGMRFPYMPTFGVPCPTTILTAGLLMLVTPRPPWMLIVIPVFWSLVGGSAAFVLGIRADLALPVAALALALSAMPWVAPKHLGEVHVKHT